MSLILICIFSMTFIFYLKPIGHGLFQYPVLRGVGDSCTKTQNPKNELASIKTLDLRVKNSLNRRVGNAIFAENRAKIQI